MARPGLYRAVAEAIVVGSGPRVREQIIEEVRAALVNAREEGKREAYPEARARALREAAAAIEGALAGLRSTATTIARELEQIEQLTKLFSFPVDASRGRPHSSLMTNTNHDATANATTQTANRGGRGLAGVMTDLLLAGDLETLAAVQAEEAAAGYERALAALVARIQANANHYHATKFPTLKPATIKIGASKRGQRFLRIWAEDDGTDNNGRASRRIVGFVEAATGLLWKAATWKAPALNFDRGSMYALPATWAVGGGAGSI